MGVISGDCKPQDIDQRSREIWKYCHDEHKLGKFMGIPCSFQIFPTIEDSCPRDDQTEDISLGEGRGEKHPGVEHGPLGDEAEEVPAVWGARVRETDDLVDG